ncbi:MAG: hypothetical protein IKZ50_06415 [Bacteroidales bacterium]|nr:hypothetical protein [Bacteroidales bacterium]
MKKVFGFIAMALALAACSKNEMNVQKVEETDGITITAQLAPKSAISKAVSEGTNKIVAQWAVNEHIAIFYTKDETEYEADARITAVDGGTGAATIEFTVEAGTPNNTACTLVYPRSAAKSNPGGVKDAATLLAAQDGTLNANLDVRVGAGTIQTTTPGLTVTTQPVPQFAIFKFTVKNSDGSAIIDVKPLTVSIDGQDYVITPSDATSTLYAALPAVSSKTVSFTAHGSDSKIYEYSKANVTFASGKYYQSTIKMPELLCVFTVNGSGKKVTFAPGNLQATYDGTSWNWHFADHQWDYIGNNSGNTSINGNGTISGTGTVDLFGWVGASSSWTGAALYGISNSKTNSDYGTGSGEALKSDWGTTIGSVWRTLTKAEWVHMLNTRSVNGGTGKGHSYTLGQSVNGKLGLVIYPDSYTGSEYAGSDWATFESLGCVFLPVTGYRSGTTVSSPDAYGVYWTGSSSGDNWAEYIYFTNSSVNTGSYTNRYTGCSVRLARVVE